MNLQTVLTPDTVNLHLKGKTKEEIIDEIAQEALEETSQMAVDEEDAIEEAQEVEEETEEV